MRGLLAVFFFVAGFATAIAEPAVDDLPVHVTEPAREQIKAVVILWSGDGGWSGSMQGIADALAERGYGVAGISSLRYFWYEQAPETMAEDTDRLVAYFSRLWKSNDVIIAGYSFGADTIPFAWPVLADDTRSKTALIALMSPFKKTEFEISLLGMLGIIRGSHDVASAIGALPADRVLCLTGDEETDMACDISGGYEMSSVPGGHSYDRNWQLIADILDGAFEKRAPD
ncbi:AcvB/VirJ family lysyl-phosphatidylglycerol hydrolase [Hoeflea sp. TYP-13]|uniref:AcvB/VirJ family lysyl-phosphatidylglycerol hydrolase n=1 Tax=Hoeflea sp. TYP-13 TaxID=3230023 RepID=UPI0034C5FBFA